MEQNKILIRWRIENNERKGEIISDPHGRKKIVFISRDYRGERMPQQNELTEGLVHRDTNMEDSGRGALLVTPIFAPDPNALSKEDAVTAMRKIIAEQPIHFGRCYLDINLPGWSGVLIGEIVVSWEARPLAMRWRFKDKNGNELVSTKQTLTEGIQCCKKQYTIIDWNQARKDLGAPSSVSEPYVYSTYVTWSDSEGSTLVADIELDTALKATYTFSQVHLEELVVYADVHMLDGGWVKPHESITRAEYYNPHTGKVTHASFSTTFKLDQQTSEEVINLLRPTLHSPEWHKERHIKRSLEHPCFVALTALLADRFSKKSYLTRELDNLKQYGDNLCKELAVEPTISERDSPIYDGFPIADHDEVAKLHLENQYAFERFNEKCTELTKAVQNAIATHTEDLIFAAREELEKMLVTLQTLIKSVGPKAGLDAEMTRDRRVLEHAIYRLALLQSEQERVEESLAVFCEARMFFFETQQYIQTLCPNPSNHHD